MKNIKLILAYDGTDFLGWQATSIGPSIEETLRTILACILQENVLLQAASRTDRGVHAEGQVVNFFTKKLFLDCVKLMNSLNALLPKSIRVIHTQEMFLSFHPTLDAIGKEYRYTICLGNVQLPQFRFQAWHVPYALDLQAMQQAAFKLSGIHDFSAFCNHRKNLRYITKQRTLFQILLHQNLDHLHIHLSGDHFLYKMVRNIVGTLIYVGRGLIPVTEISSILTSKNRSLAGITAPAHGLTLKNIFYPQEICS